jgi:hypothetical protein
MKMSEQYVIPDDLAIPSALYVDEEDGLSHENMLVMVAAECGCVVETGFQKRQYIIKKPGPGDGYNKTLYCSARMGDDTVEVTGSLSASHRFAFCDPKFFDKFGALLDDETFMMTSAKEFDEPICNEKVLEW